jgi:predicted acyl esterase
MELSMADKPEIRSEVRRYGDERIEVIYRKLRPSSKSGGRYPELAPGTTVEDGILIERDVAVPMRDGILLYTDICRPEGAINVPAIVAWSPYGKSVPYMGEGPMPGVPPVSPMTKFEGPDPAYWCKHGYAIINIDTRGSGNSEGDILQFSTGEGRDAHDLIEWLADLDWCNGKVGMSGNSWLAIAQWFAAAERPAHLTAIAPWEGFDDMYRDALCIGGVPEVGFCEMAFHMMCGPNRMEDNGAMIMKYPLMNAYWKDKIARVENIEIPAYVVASYNPLHAHGTFDAFRRMSSSEKWLRVHNTQEWADYYNPENIEDLRRFFDRYLKEIENDWERTPRVRLSVLDPGGTDIINRPEKEWPLARTQHQKLYLDSGTNTLSLEQPKEESAIRYQAGDNKGQAVFTIKFNEDIEVTGYMKLRLWVEADGADDMDIFVYISKLDENGNHLPAFVLGFPNPGVRGILRVSHRELDETRSTPSEPYLLHVREQRLKPGEIVPVEIGIWPIGMIWHAGQQLRLAVQGYAEWWMEDKFLPNGPIFRYEVRNKGIHIIHTGPQYPSYLQVPVIP